MGTRVLSEIGTLMWDHPYVSCSLLVFLTPPFLPILKFFSPLLISTALFIVALVTLGPHFEDPSEQEGDFQSPSEFGDEAGLRTEDGKKDVMRKKSDMDIRSTFSGWVKSCKDSGIAWVEQKLQNENWRGASLNDENVSILQEAFAHRAEEKPRVMVKLVTRRIPAEEEAVAEEHALQREDTPELSNSGSWKSSRSSSGRSFERPASFGLGTSTRDLPHNFFSPHPSFSRRLDSDSPLFENVVPPPIEHDMPPLITGPASITAPLFKSLEYDMDSDDEYDDHQSDHDEDMHLEVGERSLDAEFIPQDVLPVSNGTYNQPPPFIVQEEDLPSSSDSDEGRSYFADWNQRNRAVEPSLPVMDGEVHNRDIELHDQQSDDAPATQEDSASHANRVPEEHSPLADVHDERSIPAPLFDHDSHPLSIATHEESSKLHEDIELHDVPELEDVLPVENESREIPAAVVESSGSMLGDLDTIASPILAPGSHDKSDALEVPTVHAADSEGHHNEVEVPAVPTEVPVEPPHFVERSLSLPVLGSLATAVSLESATTHDDLAELDTALPDHVQEPANQTWALGHAISLPALNPIHPITIPPKTADQGPLSPDTDLGYTTTPDHEKRGLAARFFSAERYNSITSISGDESELAVPMKVLSTREKLSNLEALCNSIPSPASGETRCSPADVSKSLKATTEEQVTHVSHKLKGYIEDSPSKKFRPDAPQLQITPPSTNVGINASPSKSAILAYTLGRPSIRPPVSSSRTFNPSYSSSEESSEDEQIELDSDVDAAGTDSESDFESGQPAGMILKAPPKPPGEIHPAKPVVQGDR